MAMTELTGASLTSGFFFTEDEDPLRVFVLQLDPHDLAITPCVLEDHLQRRRPILLPFSAIIVLVPVGTLGDMVFDPTGEQADGRWIIRQRTTLCHNDIITVMNHAQVVKKDEPRVVIPGAFGVSKQ